MDSKVFVKICGLRSATSVDIAVGAGANAIGLVFDPRSPRFITPAQAKPLVRRACESVEVVGVFRNNPINEVIETAYRTGISSVQLHGTYSRTDIAQAHTEGLQVIRALSHLDYESAPDNLGLEDVDVRLLIDAAQPGSGRRFDTTLLAQNPPNVPWLLAGGLNPDNVVAALGSCSPTGVDVSSGVESSTGIKDERKIVLFVRAVRSSSPTL